MSMNLEADEVFDLEEIRSMIKDDLEDTFSGYKFTVRIRRHKRGNDEIVITVPGPGFEVRAFEVAKDYVRPAWHDSLQRYKLNFLPVIKQQEEI